MQWLWESITQAYAFLAVIPVVPFALIYFGYSAYVGDRKKAFRIAMDITMALLIGCVAVLFNHIFNSSFGFYGILLLMLIGGGLLGNLQYRTKGKLDMKRIIRAVWRVGFFIMSVMYILLMAIGIGKSFWTI
ncbi:DUF3397 domain-containing protein [Paenibacillus abyssi]|uniref:DUF3397 domain-containing protein n=1 Tax=Paenibacillus abyssi TaxID=1340531 RepID=A0A917D4U5_9BACL|nr:DUF3397 domain-containing protein [Paenibacillus abyssi]GGG10332.1 hypothetical protein GCM10010916_29000 [Paenibacillus abyssi]